MMMLLTGRMLLTDSCDAISPWGLPVNPTRTDVAPRPVEGVELYGVC